MLITLTGPSGSGKTSLLWKLVNEGVANRIVTTTTREPRKGEREGIDYYFVAKDDFQKEEMAEYTEFNNNLYGTAKEEILNAISSDKIYLVILDRRGAFNLKEQFPEIKTIYLQVKPKVCKGRLFRRDGLEKGLNRFLADRREGLYNSEGFDVVVNNNGLNFTEGYENLLSSIK